MALSAARDRDRPRLQRRHDRRAVFRGPDGAMPHRHRRRRIDVERHAHARTHLSRRHRACAGLPCGQALLRAALRQQPQPQPAPRALPLPAQPTAPGHDGRSHDQSRRRRRYLHGRRAQIHDGALRHGRGHGGLSRLPRRLRRATHALRLPHHSRGLSYRPQSQASGGHGEPPRARKRGAADLSHARPPRPRADLAPHRL